LSTGLSIAATHFSPLGVIGKRRCE